MSTETKIKIVSNPNPKDLVRVQQKPGSIYDDLAEQAVALKPGASLTLPTPKGIEPQNYRNTVFSGLQIRLRKDYPDVNVRCFRAFTLQSGSIEIHRTEEPSKPRKRKAVAANAAAPKRARKSKR